MTRAEPVEKDIHPWVAEGARRVRFGVMPWGLNTDWTIFLNWARRTEELGFDSFWWGDHPAITLDCWTGLTAAATVTKTVRLGAGVSCVYFRHPALLARIAADVDRLSGGRLILGLGIGDLPFEFARFGIDLPPVSERQAALEETITIVRGAWEGSPFSYEGKHYRVNGLAIAPPVQSPYVPLLIGGGGNRTLRQVARYADMTNFGPHRLIGGVTAPDDVKGKLRFLDGECEAVGRSSTSVLRSHFILPMILGRTDASAQEKFERSHYASAPSDQMSGGFVGSVGALIDYYQALKAAGMQYFIACISPDDTETLDLLGQEVMPFI